MHIIKLQAENIQKLRAISIVPKDNLIMVTGPNGAGKSSILDCIVMGLCGGKSIPDEPIKKGKDKGKIIIDLGDYIITRSFTKSNTYLQIQSKDGTKVESPQKFLDKIVGSVSFDPLDFINNHKPAEQRKILLELIGVDIDGLDKKEKVLRGNREIVGRDVARLKAERDALEYYDDIKETEEVEAYELTTKLAEAMRANTAWNLLNEKNESIKKNAQNKREQITTLQAQIQQLEADILEAKQLFIENKAWLDSNPIPDIGPIQSQLVNVSELNRKIRSNRDRLAKQSDYKNFSTKYDGLTREIEAIEEQRQSSLQSSPLPVPGLSFSESEILYNSIPLAQASDGEKLMISLAISMALNPELRVLRIKDGSLLDTANRQIIANQIKDMDFQLWFESVASEGGVGIYIEEGEIKSIDGIEAERPVSPPSPIPSSSSSSSSIPLEERRTKDEAAAKNNPTSEFNFPEKDDW